MPLLEKFPILLAVSTAVLLLAPNGIHSKPATAHHSDIDNGPKKIRLLTSPIDVDAIVQNVAKFKFYLDEPPKQDVLVTFQCDTSLCSTFDGNIEPVTLTADNYRAEVNFTPSYPGHDVIELHISNREEDFDLEEAFVRVRVGRSNFYYYLNLFFGWAYFFTWSISFWPQNIVNYRRKSVAGLSFDYSIFHFTGFVFYSIFNLALFYSPAVQYDYGQKFPRSEIPVELNDVVYSLHAMLSTGITFSQIFYYPGDGQKLSIFSKLFQYVVWTVGLILSILAVFSIVTWLLVVYFFSYVKLSVTAIKYMPQVYFNYKRKSTVGWSIWMVYLDICGGSLSMFQMLTIAYNYDDWKTLIGNLPKFGLAMASVVYDMIFLIQHFVLYRHSSVPEKGCLNHSSDSNDHLCNCDSYKRDYLSTAQSSPVINRDGKY